jgi:hypothetical protein
MARIATRRMSVAAALGLASVVLVPGPGVWAQNLVVSATSTIGGPGGGGQISKTSLDRYAQVLGLDDAQREMARTLHDGYAEAYQAAGKDRRDQMSALMRSSEETGDRTVFRDKMPEVMKTYRQRTDELEKSFLGDLRALLTTEQAASWPKVERMRRREVGLPRGSGLAGEGIDLTEVARALDLKVEGLSATLDQYELDLDRAIQDRLAEMQKFADVRPGPDPMRMDAMQEMMAKSRELGAKIRDLNQSYARRIESLLPDSAKPAFSTEMRRRTFPQVFREPHTMKQYAAALGFSDLTTDQRASIEADKASYDRDLAAANDRWIQAIMDSEKDGQSGMVSLGDGQMMRMSFGEEPGPLNDARKARRELDERFRDRLASRLTKAQQERLPKREEPQSGQVFEGAQMLVIDGR